MASAAACLSTKVGGGAHKLSVTAARPAHSSGANMFAPTARPMNHPVWAPSGSHLASPFGVYECDYIYMYILQWYYKNNNNQSINVKRSI